MRSHLYPPCIFPIYSPLLEKKRPTYLVNLKAKESRQVVLIWLWLSIFQWLVNYMKFLLNSRHLLPPLSHLGDWQVPPTKPTQDDAYVMPDPKKKKMFFLSQKLYHAVLISQARNLSSPSLCLLGEKLSIKLSWVMWKIKCMEMEVAI